MACTQHLDPHASGIVNVRRDRPNCAARRAGNGLGPQLRRQLLNEIHGYSMARPPRGDQRFSVFPIFEHCRLLLEALLIRNMSTMGFEIGTCTGAINTHPTNVSQIRLTHGFASPVAATSLYRRDINRYYRGSLSRFVGAGLGVDDPTT